MASRAFFGATEPDRPSDSTVTVPFDGTLKALKSPVPMTTAATGYLKTLMGMDAAWKISSIIMTVPDPIHTRLQLFADEQIEAIARSAQADGWEFAAQWLPWLDRLDGSKADINDRRKQRFLQRQQEALPGLLVFRSRPGRPSTPGAVFERRVLLIFVVPETPTAGISKASFFGALQTAATVTNFGEIGLLGPTFSGSLPSLENVLEAWYGEQHPDSKPIHATVYSGSVTARTYVEAFENTLNRALRANAATQKTPPPSCFELRSMLAPEDDNSQALRELLTKYGISSDDAAFLREDETAYGDEAGREMGDPKSDHSSRSDGQQPGSAEGTGQPASDGAASACPVKTHDQNNPPSKTPNKEDPAAEKTSAIRTYVFPRDIAHVRNAYQEATAQVQLPNASQPTIAFSLRDPNSGEDSIPEFSDAQSPLAQDAVIASIAEDMRRRRTRFVYIAATNVLDTMFLARFFRLEYPDIRVASTDPGILFIPAAAKGSLSGTMFLSTYPMFLEGNDWLTSKDISKMIFPSPQAQGAFNALQFLLPEMVASHEPNSYPANPQSYAQPGQPHPGLWLLTLNGSSFEPLALFDRQHSDDKKTSPHDDWFAMGARKAEDFPTYVDPPLSWALVTLLLTAGSMVGWFQIKGNFWKGLTVEDSPAVAPAIAMCLSLSATLYILISPVLGMRFMALCKPPTPYAGIFLGVFLGAALITSLAVCLLCIRNVIDETQTDNGESGSGFRVKGPASSDGKEGTFHKWVAAGLVVVALASYLGLASLLRGGPWSWPLKQWIVGSLAAAMCLLLAFEGMKLVARLLIATCSREQKLLLLYGSAATVAFASVILAWTYVCFSSQPADNTAFLARFRAIRIFSGSSPTLPLLLCGLTIFWAARFYAVRFRDAGATAPRLSFDVPETETGGNPGNEQKSKHSQQLKEWKERLKDSYNRVNGNILAAVELEPLSLMGRFLLGLLITAACFFILQDDPFAFESGTYNFALVAAYALMVFSLVTGSLDLWKTWSELRRFLREIELLPSNVASIKKIAANWPTRPVWQVRGETSKQSNRMELFKALRHTTEAAAEYYGAENQSWKLDTDVEELSDLQKRDEAAFQKRIAGEADKLLTRVLIPEWRESWWRENPSTDETKRRFMQAAEDTFTLVLVRFIVYAVGQIRNMAWTITFSFIGLLVVSNSYNPRGPLLIARFLACAFLALGFVIVWVFFKMERNRVLSLISKTSDTQLSSEFWTQIVSFGSLPLLGVIAHLFPQVSQFLVSWVAPSLQDIH